MLSRLLPAHRPGSAAPGGLESGMIEVGEGETLEGLQARLEQQRHSLAEAALGAHASREQKYAVLRQVAAEDPTRIAMALRRMIKDEIDKVK
jgi:flagellar M-ring protein FliF